MLTYPVSISEEFGRREAAALDSFKGYRLPREKPFPGELSVMRTFTEEWEGLKDDELTFAYNEEDLLALHRDVWIREPEERLSSLGMVLNAGVGYGRESEVLSRIFPRADIVALDLNTSLLSAAPRLAREGRVHPVIASLFRPPFEAGTFDHVHSQGVIHHTYSTKAAFDSLDRLVSPGGSLFIWVYAIEDGFAVKGPRGLLVRTYWFISHRISRPILSRSPAMIRNAVTWMIAAMMHIVIRGRVGRKKEWKFRNTLHGIRDAFTPRYADQLSFNEVVEWFEEAGYGIRLQSPSKFRRLFNRRSLGIGIMGVSKGTKEPEAGE